MISVELVPPTWSAKWSNYCKILNDINYHFSEAIENNYCFLCCRTAGLPKCKSITVNFVALLVDYLNWLIFHFLTALEFWKMSYSVTTLWLHAHVASSESLTQTQSRYCL